MSCCDNSSQRDIASHYILCLSRQHIIMGMMGGKGGKKAHEMQEKFSLQLPEYPGGAQCVSLGKHDSKKDPSGMRMNYDIAERQGGLLEEHVDKDPLKQFDRSATQFHALLCSRYFHSPNLAYVIAQKALSADCKIAFRRFGVLQVAYCSKLANLTSSQLA